MRGKAYASVVAASSQALRAGQRPEVCKNCSPML
jgi:hypothetical protein